MLEKQKAAHALAQQGSLPLGHSHAPHDATAGSSSRPTQPQPLGDEASRSGSRPVQSGATSSGIREDESDLQNGGAANLQPTEESLGRCISDEADLALLPGQKPGQLKEPSQESGRPQKEKTRFVNVPVLPGVNYKIVSHVFLAHLPSSIIPQAGGDPRREDDGRTGKFTLPIGSKACLHHLAPFWEASGRACLVLHEEGTDRRG